MPCFIVQCKNGEGGSGNLAFDDMISSARASIVFVVSLVMGDESTVSCCEGGREFFHSTSIRHFRVKMSLVNKYSSSYFKKYLK